MALIDQVTEAEFQQMIMHLARACRWTYFHFHDSRRQAGGRLIGDKSAAGFPDLVLVHPLHGIIFAELKRQKTKPTPGQIRALDKLAEAALGAAMTGCKVRVHLWRPLDFETVIEPLLKTGQGPLTYGDWAA